MKNAASEGPIVNGAAMHETGEAGPDLLPLAVDFVSEEAAPIGPILGLMASSKNCVGSRPATNEAEHS